jgi:Fur family transcriptional regulator, peroxide stress response regulator
MKKLTRHRQIIFDNLSTRRDHPTAKMVYDSVQNSSEKFSFATVYNSLEYLVEEKLIKKLNIESESIRYDAVLENHVHLLCKCCGGIYDHPLSNSTIAIDTDEMSFVPEDITITMRGVCAICIVSNVSFPKSLAE